MPKAAKNLYLDPDVVEHGERYGKLHGTSLSRLVSDFLRALPLEQTKNVAPSVRRLIGAAVPRDSNGHAGSVDEYHQHLVNKYGQR